MIKHTYENYPYQLSMSWGDNIMHDVMRLPSYLSVLKDFIKMASRKICTTEILPLTFVQTKY